jgi:hypothetical protein
VQPTIRAKKNNEISPEVYPVVVRFDDSPKKLRGYEIIQFPVNLALAYTVFSMEGTTKDIIIVIEVSDRICSWLYAVLSHLATLNGLFLQNPLKREMFKPLSMNVEDELSWLRLLENDFIGQLGVNE